DVEAGMPLLEMELLHAAGLTPMEVIEAGTRHAAFVCGQQDDIGTLEPGKLADIIIVDGDPLADLSTMDRVVAVIKGGQLAYRTEDAPDVRSGA
ncbi:MAG: amidohydrolase family protein, partial [Gemmatimonadota bacterium]